ncbi:lysosome-associated membrane glycoprotein 2 isoform X1 [Gasterosteus aculeatus]|uniref:lysosome-associated membrane glycoprotein 2 isoform X1 n=1 Tax=Gasterosteus aculeatus aculeatus TaxID=481459 RepID=UPI001A99D780|nr:lysosome-associated membrane glycoprotein 2 isoform X1 [Gasterosteus aculeatus aculeatus]
MYRYASFVLFLAFGIAVQRSNGTEVTVKDDNDNICLYAKLMVNFTVSYEVAGNTSATGMFELPVDVSTNGSTCKNTSSTLKLNFGPGHSWSVNFTANGKMYHADTITLSYNLSDATIFPNSASNDTKVVTAETQITNVGIDTCYSCRSVDTIAGKSVNQTLWNVLIQAFVSNNSTSENITSCAADVPVTTVAPTTRPTTAAPVTNSSTTAPTPTTTPTPTLPTPATGRYDVKPDQNSTACLIAEFGLRIGVKNVEMNFEPNGTTSSGSCGVDSSQLVLVSNAVTITLTFLNDTKKFHLHALNVTGKTSSGVAFSEANTNLSLWEAAVGSSYMCNKEQNYTITGLLTLYTFDLRVQPFGVNKGVFSTAEDCQADAESFIVPIAVGVALLVLILIVLLAYFIGRKRNMASTYESL